MRVTLVCLCYGHASLKRAAIFHWIAVFDTTKTKLTPGKQKKLTVNNKITSK